MVDFQSRDTRRGVSDDEDETDDEDDSASDETSVDQSGGETDHGTSTADAAREDGTAGDDAGAATDDAEDPAATSDADQSAARHPAGGAAGSKVATDQPTASTGPDDSSVAVALVTVGTTTDEGEDPTAAALETAIESAGHSVTTRERLRGDYDGIQKAVDTIVGRDDVEVVVTAGGVGIEPSEATIEAVHPLFEKALPGFGEAFRTLLFEHIGTGVVAVRATAGISDGTPVFCLPADAEAAALAVDEIIAAEAPELVDHLQD